MNTDEMEIPEFLKRPPMTVAEYAAIVAAQRSPSERQAKKATEEQDRGRQIKKIADKRWRQWRAGDVFNGKPSLARGPSFQRTSRSWKPNGRRKAGRKIHRPQLDTAGGDSAECKTSGLGEFKVSHGLPKKAYRRLFAALEKLRTANAVFTKPNTLLLVVTTDADCFIERDGIKYARVEKTREVTALADAVNEVEAILSQ